MKKLSLFLLAVLFIAGSAFTFEERSEVKKEVKIEQVAAIPTVMPVLVEKTSLALFAEYCTPCSGGTQWCTDTSNTMRFPYGWYIKNCKVNPT